MVSEIDFQAQIRGETRLSLVGPMFKGRYRARFPTIYVDRGADFSDFPGAAPSLRVGDRDSASSSMDVLLPKAKDRSDLACALALVPAQITHLDLFGFLGGRRDHELIGLGEVNVFLRGRPGTRADFDGSAIHAFGAGSYRLTVNGTFSLISFAENTITLTGACAYTLPESFALEPVSSHGLSNEGSGEIQLTCAQPIFLFNT